MTPRASLSADALTTSADAVGRCRRARGMGVPQRVDLHPSALAFGWQRTSIESSLLSVASELFICQAEKPLKDELIVSADARGGTGYVARYKYSRHASLQGLIVNRDKGLQV